MPLIERDCDVTYKVLIVGDSGVGKTAILDCLMGREFNENSRPTVGVDFVRKIVEADGALVQLRIWDTAGLERFRSITRLQYRGVQGLIIVYDVTDETSFHSVEYWLSSIQHIRSPHRHPYEPLPFVVVGNKSDVIDRKKVSLHQGSKLAKKEMAFGFYEISAKTGSNVYQAFHSLAYHITDISHPKLMKSYHPNFIRPMGVKPVMSAEMNRLSAPCFSSLSPYPSSTTSPRQRYSLWNPLIPWSSYTVKPLQPVTRKHKVKRLKFRLPFFKLRRKKKSTVTAPDGIGLGSDSKMKQNGVALQDPSGSKANRSRRHEKKRFRRFFHFKNRGARNKKRSVKKRGSSKNGKGKSKKTFKVAKRRSHVKDRRPRNASRSKTLRTRIAHFLCSCFQKQKVD